MSCPICDLNFISNSNGIRNIWNEKDKVLFCKKCELYFLESIPSQDRIDKFYKQEYHHHSKPLHLIKNIFRRFRSANQFKYIKSNITSLEGKKVLEIGACDGLLLSYFNDSIVKGLEYSPVYKKIASRRYGINLLSKNFFDLDEKFDLIIMSHVIEHLPNLNLAIKKLQDLLSDSGYLFIEVPNSPKPNERSSLYIDDYLTTPHIYNFTSISLKKLFIKYNFKISCMDRFFYALPKHYSVKKQEEIASIFLKGQGLKIKYIFSICLYIIKKLINPKKSYKKLPLNSNYAGPSDNLRIILSK